jgi:DNA-binding CsgD family transcriptional regulator
MLQQAHQGNLPPACATGGHELVVAIVLAPGHVVPVAVRRDGTPSHDAAGSLARDALTRRQVEVLQLVSGGATDKEVAGALGISPRTVQKHLEHAYARLGVHRRTGAALAVVARAG